MAMDEHYGYAIDKRYLPVLLPFVLRPSRDGVTLTDDGRLAATFGFFKIATPLLNVTDAHITRNYRWWTSCGVRMSRVDDGLTFGTNHDGGVCIHLRGEGAFAIAKKRTLSTHRDRCRPGGPDNGFGSSHGRARDTMNRTSCPLTPLH